MIIDAKTIKFDNAAKNAAVTTTGGETIDFVFLAQASSDTTAGTVAVAVTPDYEGAIIAKTMVCPSPEWNKVMDPFFDNDEWVEIGEGAGVYLHVPEPLETSDHAIMDRSATARYLTCEIAHEFEWALRVLGPDANSALSAIVFDPELPKFYTQVSAIHGFHTRVLKARQKQGTVKAAA